MLPTYVSNLIIRFCVNLGEGGIGEPYGEVIFLWLNF